MYLVPTFTRYILDDKIILIHRKIDQQNMQITDNYLIIMFIYKY